MTNTPQNVTTLHDLLNQADVNSRLNMIFQMGNLEMAKMYLDNLLSDPQRKLAAKESAFDMEFKTPNGVVVLSYSNNKITMTEKRKQQEQASLEDRIKNGTAPIEEIERALADGSLKFPKFKEATEHLEPHVSAYYRLLLTHENQVYLAKEAPAIKVTLSGGVLYTTEERVIEKEERERREAIQKQDGDLSAEDLKLLYLGMTKPNSLEEQVLYNQQLMFILNQLQMIDDPEVIKSLIGIDEEHGVVFAEENGTLVIQNKEEIITNMEETVEAHEVSSEVTAETDERLNEAIHDLRSDLRLNDAGELSVKKDELRLEVEERILDGEDPNKVLEDVTAAADRSITEVTTKEPEMALVASAETIVPGTATLENNQEEQTPTTQELIEEKTEKAATIIESGQIPGPTMRKIIEEQFEGPNGQDPKKVAAKERMIQKLAEKGVFNGYEKDLEGLQVGGVEFTKGGSTVQVERGAGMAKRQDMPNAA